jgi:hypothetical protein
MDYEEMKLECLKLAGGDIAKAEKFYEFCRGRGEHSVIQNAHVRVHGKDGDLGKFTDYVKDPDAKF